MDVATQLVHEIEAEFPAFRIVSKRNHFLSQVIDIILKIVTLGQQRDYLTTYHTVLGYTLYVPESWESTLPLDRAILLRHERVHLRQRRRYGSCLMAFLYLVPFLPMGLAYGRARLEWEAYTETLRATAEWRGLDAARAASLRRHIITRFVGGDYGWMWPFPHQIERWYDRALKAIELEFAASPTSEERS